MPAPLLITADDFGLGPETSRGILDLAIRGIVTSTVMLVTSPFAAEGVAQWKKAGRPVELGWHPCLTLDKPLLPAAQVPSLVTAQGRFRDLGPFLAGMALGQVSRAEIQAELRAQLQRFVELTGQLPANVNAHHHVHVFRPVGESLATVLRDLGATPFVRRVIEPAALLRRVGVARLKRAFLGRHGRRAARRQAAAGFAGADVLLGVGVDVAGPALAARWVRAAAEVSPGRAEWVCHPGYLDAAVEGRDGSFTDGRLHRRQRELEALRDPGFLDAVRAAGYAPAAAMARPDAPLSRAG